MLRQPDLIRREIRRRQQPEQALQCAVVEHLRTRICRPMEATVTADQRRRLETLSAAIAMKVDALIALVPAAQREVATDLIAQIADNAVTVAVLVVRHSAGTALDG